MGATSDSHCIGLRELPIPHLLRPAPLRRRLWQGGIALALFIVTAAVTNYFVAPEKALARDALCHDFIAFYTAGTFVREGRMADLYDLPAAKSFQHELTARHGIDIGQAYGPYWNPPFYAMLFVPLSALSYPAATDLWLVINIACLLLAIALLLRMLPPDLGWRTWALVPLLVLISMPAIQALTHGQNTCISLLLLAAVVQLWRENRGLLAGLACGLLFYKPQLAAVVAGVLVLCLGWKPLAGLAISGTALLATTLIAMPGVLQHYLHQLPLNLHYAQVERPYIWERHATLKSFWRLLLQGHEPGPATSLTTLLFLGMSALIVTALLIAILRTRRPAAADQCWSGETTALRRDRLIAATIATMPLLMPFYFDYDLLLLAIPAVLLAGEMLRRDSNVSLSFGEVWLLRCWILLFVWMMANPAVAERTGVNMNVLLLCCIAGLLIRRAWGSDEPPQQTQRIANPQPAGTIVRQAA